MAKHVLASMKIEEIANIIEESSREIAQEEDKCCDSDKTASEFVIDTVGQLINCELFELGKLVFELGDITFSDDENPEGKNPEEEKPDRTAFYKKIDEADKPLNAIRKLAEMKRYFEAQNRGELQAQSKLSPD
jgi:hypothetical protein